MSDVLVYPNDLRAQASRREVAFLEDTGEYWSLGQRVKWFYVNGRSTDDCAYCQDGRCEQRVETCGSWGSDVVIHDRPRVMQ